MSSFELSNHVEGGKENARDVVGSLKALQQTLKDTEIDINILQDLNVCVFKTQELLTESFLFIEKEAINARKMADFLTDCAISEVVGRLADQARRYTPQNKLAVLVLRYYFGGTGGDTNRKNLEARLREAEEIGSLGDYPWTCNFEDVLEKYRVKVEKLALEYVVEEAKEMFEKDEEETAEHCKNLAKRVFDTLEEAYVKAYNAKNLAHYIADKAIRDAVAHLAAQMRMQNPRTPMVAVVLEMLFSNPEGNDKRKDLEARIKAKMGLGVLNSGDESKEFAEKVQAFEKEAGELALEFAIEDAKKMVDENLRMLAMA
ncbi:hypothetical protein KCU64_g11633, partial [Aureobasidium melanogenum]